MYHFNMSQLKGKFLFKFVLFLAVFLQGVMPFLHAHTGVSTITGLHAPEIVANYHSFDHSAFFTEASKPSDESTIVKVGIARANENVDLSFIPACLAIILATVSSQQFTRLFTGFLPEPAHRFGFSFYSSESYPPPTLAPPTHTL